MSYLAANKRTGGERGIRTPDTRKGIHAFEARAFSHSAISPRHQFRFHFSRETPPRIFPLPRYGYARVSLQLLLRETLIKSDTLLRGLAPSGPAEPDRIRIRRRGNYE